MICLFLSPNLLRVIEDDLWLVFCGAEKYLECTGTRLLDCFHSYVIAQVFAWCGKYQGEFGRAMVFHFGETVGRAKILMTRPNKPFSKREKTCTITCLSSPTKKCIFENKILSTRKTSFMREHAHTPVSRAWELDKFWREFVMNACVCCFVFSPFIVFYEAIQWFHAGGNSTFAAEKPHCLWLCMKSWHCGDSSTVICPVTGWNHFLW